jgi:flagellar basal body-associated protein FliL
MRRLLLALTLVLAATQAPAAAPKKGEGEPSQGQYVDISPAALPIIVNGRLRNYVFVAVRVNLTPKAPTQKLREKEPYLRDAMVRAAHRAPFVVAGDPTRVDESRLRAALAPEASRILGAGMVQSIVVTSQTPQRRAGLRQSASR